MKERHGVTFALKKVFLNFDAKGKAWRWIEDLAYFTDLNMALKEKKKYRDSFIFPFHCHFYKDRRAKDTLLRPLFHFSSNSKSSRR